MIYLLYSEDKIWLDNQYSFLCKKIGSDYNTFSYEWNIENKIIILNQILNNDLFVNKKIILIKHYKSDQEINNIIKKWNSDQQELVIIITSVDKLVLKLNPKIKILKNTNLSSKKLNKKTLLQMFLDNNNLKIEPNLFDWLINNNIAIENIIAELSKIKHLDYITFNDVQNYADLKINNSIFELLDNLWTMNFGQLLKIYNNLDLNINQIFYFINNEYKNIYLIKSLLKIYSRTEVQEQLKMHPYRFNNLLKKSQKIDFKTLHKIFEIFKENQINLYKFFIDKSTITQILIYDINKLICII